MPRYAIIVAAGSGTRFGGAVPKQLLPLPDGRPILLATLQAFAALGAEAPQLIVVLSQSVEAAWQTICQTYADVPAHTVVEGGATRSESVRNGLAHVPDDALVAIHDGVRPYVSSALLEACYQAAALHGAAVAAVPCTDSLRRRLPAGGSAAVPREEFVQVQTPQTFSAALIKRAYRKAPPDALFTDDASVAEAAGYPVVLVEGEYGNVKITTREDLVS